MSIAVASGSNLAVSCTFYLFASAGMSVFNKMAIIALPLPITLVMVQMLFTVATIGANWRSVHIGSRRDALRWGCTVPLLFSAMLVSSMIAMEHNTLGTVVVFRNVAPLFTLLIERMFRIPMQVSRGTVLSLLAIILGVALYHREALSLSSVGFLAIVCNMVFAVLERLLQRHLMAQEPVDISKPGMMLLNNSCGLAPNLLLLLLYQEPPRWEEAWGGLSTRGAAMIALSCLNGLAISYAGLRVQQLVTATTFMVLTNVNKAPATPRPPPPPPPPHLRLHPRPRLLLHHRHAHQPAPRASPAVTQGAGRALRCARAGRPDHAPLLARRRRRHRWRAVVRAARACTRPLHASPRPRLSTSRRNLHRYAQERKRLDQLPVPRRREDDPEADEKKSLV